MQQHNSRAIALGGGGAIAPLLIGMEEMGGSKGEGERSRYSKQYPRMIFYR
ncbi:MAG: hypothetical protein F6K19_48330 [Cyanothece sp. SIO1E1]|nr:hypothetical protein [Cyanothece sp. SIO1E1]